MRLLGILAVVFFVFYLFGQILPGSPDLEDDMEFITIEAVRFTRDAGVLVQNVSDQALDRVKVRYTIFATTSSGEDSDRTGELPAESQIAPGETVFLPFNSVRPNVNGEVHYRIDSISYREAPF
jgi:hypothetical protein